MLEVADLKYYAKIDEIFNQYKPTAVIHFAALKAVGESVAHPLMYYENNVGGTVNLLKAMEKHGCGTIVFSSSACVYGDNPCCKEEDPLQPINPYGQTKVMCEQIMKDYCVAHPDFIAIALRYFNPIGAHQSGLIGEEPKGIPNNIMPYIQKVASGQLPHLNIFGNDYDTPDGTGVRDYIHVVDLALGHIAAMNQKSKGFSVFNLGTGSGTSVLELVAACEKAYGHPIKTQMQGRRPGDAPKCTANVDKANTELGWRTKLSIDDMCRDSCNWTKNNPNGYE